MRISYLKEFIVLGKHLNFSYAAKLLNMTQPGLSRHIVHLEEDLGCKLLERNKHRVELTKSGEKFLSNIETIVQNYEALCQEINHLNKKRLVLGVPNFGIKEYISDYVENFSSLHANIELVYFPANFDEVIESLFSEKIDLAILPKVVFPRCEELISYEAFSEPMIVALHRDHPLACRQNLRLADLKNESFIKIQYSGTYTSTLFEQHFAACRKYGHFEPDITLNVKTIEAAVLNLRADGGILLLPAHLKDSHLSVNIKYIDIVDPEYSLTICIYHQRKKQDPAMKLFVDYYVERSRKESSHEPAWLDQT